MRISPQHTPVKAPHAAKSLTKCWVGAVARPKPPPGCRPASKTPTGWGNCAGPQSPLSRHGREAQCALVRSHPDPTANAAASTPPATPDAAPAPTAARTGPHPNLGLLDPIVEGARDAVVQRHRACRFGGPSQTRRGGSGAKQNPARQGAAVDLFHRTIPPKSRPTNPLSFCGSLRQRRPDRDHDYVTE
jgi:hypothetical protein